MALSLQIIPKGFEEAEKILTAAGKNFRKLAKDAVLRGLQHGRTEADKLIRARYAIQKKPVMAQLNVELEAGGGYLEAKGPMLPVSKFKPVQKKTGVAVTILKGKRGVIEHAFIRKGKVWIRTTPKRIPIEIVRTAGVPLMISVKQVSDKVQKAIEERTSKRMADNVARAMAGKTTAFG